jgi:hypothetical protein
VTLVTVEVRKGHTVKARGKYHGPGAKLQLPEDDAAAIGHAVSVVGRDSAASKPAAAAAAGTNGKRPAGKDEAKGK